VAQDQNRLLVRFDADALDVVLPTLAAPGLAESIRVVEPGNTLAIQLGPRFASFRTTAAPSDAPSTHVVVDLLPALPGSGPVGTPPPQGGLAPLEPLPPIAAPTVRTIVLDPGHGGTEDGVRGASGTVEKDVTLGVARKLKAMLEGRLGVRVMLTRDGDSSVTLDDRAALANNNKADVFVSIHANAFINSGPYGTTCYISKPEDVPLGRMVEAHLAQDGTKDDGVIKSHLYVTYHTRMPAVLVESAFLTNPSDYALLASAAWRQKVAEEIADGIGQYTRAYPVSNQATQ
jgi:N-acetylmuramoyl-L-alanine amidase